LYVLSEHRPGLVTIHHHLDDLPQPRLAIAFWCHFCQCRLALGSTNREAASWRHRGQPGRFRGRSQWVWAPWLDENL
jgi:hypothetical protein